MKIKVTVLFCIRDQPALGKTREFPVFDYVVKFSFFKGLETTIAYKKNKKITKEP